ncbi:MAG: ABC transporter substrate-binding protein [Lachnospiraceae bacterium]|nr:ABC transporter substrate-binding protein [Lachnospiraceae bacterium]
MKLKKVMAVGLASVMAMSMAACGSSSSTSTASTGEAAGSTAAASGASEGGSSASGVSYADIKLGETDTDLKAEIKVLTNRTDMMKDDYNGKNWASYIEDFNKIYPNIKINMEGVTDYASDTLTRLQGGSWGDVMLIPAIDKADLPNYFLPYGSVDEMSKLNRFADSWSYDGQCYGVATVGNAQGVVYNKKVFQDAGITELPKTPDEFLADLKTIKEKTDAIPLYTNYAAGWTMSAWDGYVTGTATGDAKYFNQVLPHTRDPFSDPGDGTHAYNVYKILYEAVKNGYTEDDYTTTDWESSKSKLNNGEIATMMLGSWAFGQMQAAGDHPDDVGYMPFPMTVNGKQYSSTSPDYSFGIAKDLPAEEEEASLIWVKWITEESGWAYNENCMPVAQDITKFPALFDAFDGVEYVTDEPALEGEEDLVNNLNSTSELAINAGGDAKVQAIVEAASTGSETFDDIMNEWNQKWDDAMDAEGVEAVDSAA